MPISTHAPRTGSDVAAAAVLLAHIRFQPTLPARGATTPPRQRCRCCFHFNPRSPHGERREAAARNRAACANFNPRSPHGERRCRPSSHTSPRFDFNPRSPHGERRNRKAGNCPPNYFNPRSPHGERPSRQPEPAAASNFNPRSPHGERPGTQRATRTRRISTHAPRTGSDQSVIAGRS